MKKMNRKGFTIVELVIVIAVIAILAAVLIPTFSGITARAQESARLQETRNAMMNYLAQQENGVIANNTEFYYFEDGVPTETKTVNVYKYVYANGKLTAEKNTVAVEVTVTPAAGNVEASTAFEIADASVTLVATDNAKVLLKTPAAN